jgi:hypothetical protein
MLRIKASCTQLGLAVDASMDGVRWQCIQISKYKERSRQVDHGHQQTVYIDPSRDRAEYLATIRARGIEYVEVKE